MVQPQLNRDAALLARVFPADTVKTAIVTIRRVAPEGKPFIPRAPLPEDTHGAIVELVLSDHSAKKEDDRERRGPPGTIGGFGMLAASSVDAPRRARVELGARERHHTQARAVDACRR